MFEILNNPYFIVNVYVDDFAVNNIIVQTIPSGKNLIIRNEGKGYRTNYSALNEFCKYINQKNKEELYFEFITFVQVKPFDNLILEFVIRLNDEISFDLYHSGLNCREAIIRFKSLLQSDVGKEFLFEKQIKPRDFLQIVQNEFMQYQLSIIKKSKLKNCLELDSPRLGIQLSKQLKKYKENGGF